MLSKSKYLNGLQCPRLLWIAVNEPDRLPAPNAATQHIFDQGHLVGELAHRLFPGGVRIQTDDFGENIRQTRVLLKGRKPLFEAGITAGNLYARADILNPAGERAWDIIEVKSSTSVKDVNVEDAAFQKYCYEQAGLEINRCSIMHINNKYVRAGEIDPRQLFASEDITGAVATASEGIQDRINDLLAVIASETCQAPDIGPRCGDPYPCALTECWDGLPEHHVFTLYYGGKKAYELYRSGIREIAGIPPGYKLNDKQRIQCNCVVTGKTHTDKEAIRQFLAGLEYPLYYLDFETFGTAIPLFDGTRPYQNIPFQFSLHVQETPGGGLRHHSFLADGAGDPRPALLAELDRLISDKGCVIAYNKSFEENVLKDLGAGFPEHHDCIDNILSRMVDLIVPFRSFHYYHPSQKGSASLKSVLPAVTGSGYEDMAIARGDDASLAFLRITFEDVPPEEEAQVRADLLNYCKLDTEGMVRIVERLGEIAG